MMVNVALSEEVSCQESRLGPTCQIEHSHCETEGRTRSDCVTVGSSENALKRTVLV